MAQIRRLGVFAGISVLAMVHQVREHCMSLLPDVIGASGGGYAGLCGHVGGGARLEEALYERPRGGGITAR
jgi:hypothetical protein